MNRLALIFFFVTPRMKVVGFFHGIQAHAFDGTDVHEGILKGLFYFFFLSKSEFTCIQRALTMWSRIMVRNPPGLWLGMVSV